MISRIKFAFTITCAALLLSLIVACSLSARTEKMVFAGFEPEKKYSATLQIKVFGDDIGGFASAAYPFPRDAYEKALLQSLLDGDMFEGVNLSGNADFVLTVGLIQLIQPQMGGKVTLETTWSIKQTAQGSAIANTAIRTETLADFSTKREATERAAQESIRLGMRWLDQILP